MFCIVLDSVSICCVSVISIEGLIGFCFCGMVEELFVFLSWILLMFDWVIRIRFLFILVRLVVMLVIYVVSVLMWLCLVC